MITVDSNQQVMSVWRNSRISMQCLQSIVCHYMLCACNRILYDYLRHMYVILLLRWPCVFLFSLAASMAFSIALVSHCFHSMNLR